MCNNLEISDFYCTQCGTKNMPVWRKKGKLREAGHLKKLYCLHCKKETNNCEVKPLTHYDFETFKTEFEYGNFTAEGLRELPTGELLERIRNGKRKKVKSLDNGGSTGWR